MSEILTFIQLGIINFVKMKVSCTELFTAFKKGFDDDKNKDKMQHIRCFAINGKTKCFWNSSQCEVDENTKVLTLASSTIINFDVCPDVFSMLIVPK